jgi:hypothetical protein
MDGGKAVKSTKAISANTASSHLGLTIKAPRAQAQVCPLIQTACAPREPILLLFTLSQLIRATPQIAGIKIKYHYLPRIQEFPSARRQLRPLRQVEHVCVKSGDPPKGVRVEFSSLVSCPRW